MVLAEWNMKQIQQDISNQLHSVSQSVIWSFSLAQGYQHSPSCNRDQSSLYHFIPAFSIPCLHSHGYPGHFAAVGRWQHMYSNSDCTTWAVLCKLRRLLCNRGVARNLRRIRRPGRRRRPQRLQNRQGWILWRLWNVGEHCSMDRPSGWKEAQKESQRRTGNSWHPDQTPRIIAGPGQRQFLCDMSKRVWKRWLLPSTSLQPSVPWRMLAAANTTARWAPARERSYWFLARSVQMSDLYGTRHPYSIFQMQRRMRICHPERSRTSLIHLHRSSQEDPARQVAAKPASRRDEHSGATVICQLARTRNHLRSDSRHMFPGCFLIPAPSIQHIMNIHSGISMNYLCALSHKGFCRLWGFTVHMCTYVSIFLRTYLLQQYCLELRAGVICSWYVRTHLLSPIISNVILTALQ